MTAQSLLAAGLLLAAAATVAGAAPQADPLAAHRWTARVLVVLAPDEADGALAEQRRILTDARAGTRDRDLVVVEGIGRGSVAEALRRQLGIEPGVFRAVLVGKDGGAKLASDRPIAARDLFAEIDSMPMRRDEMRTRGR